MLDPLTAALLGAAQGLTEYLPVSSSGHLVIAQSLFGLAEPVLFFDITLHLGTLAALLYYYRGDVAAVFRGAAEGLKDIRGGEGWAKTLRARPGLRLGALIAVGTIPTGLVGVFFKDDFERMFGSPKLAGAMLIVTGAMLFLTRWAPGGGRPITRVGWAEAVIIGVAQGLAITPGISRSGATISAALFLGVEKEDAARFSFLLSAPSIIGAMALGFEPDGGGVPPSSLALGFLASAAVGYICLALLVALLKRGKFSWFSYYCFAAGALTLAFVG
ncbi:MAG: undecaprenyl-diphosphate phosphatase [Candidatus Nitrospinota bacterium M3_3B_026]